MRTHLGNSLERVRALALASGIEAADRTSSATTLFAGLSIAAAKED
jgi:hypothetical protein